MLMTGTNSADDPAASLLAENGEAGLGELFHRYRDRLRGAVKVRLDPRLLGRVDPSDIIQEAWVEARQRLPEYQRNPRMSPFVWIRLLTMQRVLIIHRRHLEAKQRDARREFRLNNIGPHASSMNLASLIVSAEPTPSQNALRDEQQTQLHDAFEEMEPTDREVLVLKHFEQLSNGEVAEVLEISVAAASRRYYRARHPIEEIAEEFTSRCRSGDRPSIDEYAKRFPEHAQEIRELFPALLLVEKAAVTDTSAALRSETHTGAAENSTAPVSDFHVPERIGRFEVRDAIGGGGFGVVFDAFDTELQRRVALKIPRPEAAVNTEFRRRFQREAEAAALLDHPNIVPVYEAGDEGICYIAAAFVDGMSLAQWLHDRSASVGPRDAAMLVEALAHGVQHAHSRGVIHRDLKPANILLAEGARGDRSSHEPQQLSEFTPRIADFGLARLIDEGSPQTRTNAILGTAAYMAPEQAEGDSRSVGTPADVYSLGTILYELLTGSPPFQHDTTLKTLQAVRNELPETPRRLRDDIPPDLEAVCLKCLEKQPDRRYASAAELAADLRRYLSSEAVTARTLTRTQRAIRWCIRKPLQAALLAMLLISISAICGTVVAANVQLNSKNDELLATNRELDEANQDLVATNAELKRARNRSAGNFRRARTAANMLLGELALGGGAASPHLPSIRGALADKVVEFHQSFVDEQSSDPAVRRDTGRALSDIGIIEFRRKNFDRARSTLRSAIRFLEAAPPTEGEEQLETRTALANDYLFLAIIEVNSGRRDKGESLLETSETLWRDIALHEQIDTTTRLMLADSYDLRRLGFQLMGRPAKAQAVCMEAEPLLQSLESSTGNDAQAKIRVAAVSLHCGILLSRTGKSQAAERHLIRAKRLAERLHTQSADESGLTALLATAHQALGSHYRRSQTWEKSRVAHKSALELFAELAEQHPLSPIYRQQLAQQYARIAFLQRQNRDTQQARENYLRAVSITESLRDSYPRFQAYQFDLAVHKIGLAYTEFRLKNIPAATVAAESACGLLEPLAKSEPENALYRSQLGIAQGHLATFTASPSRIRENRRLLEQSVENLSAAAKTEAGNVAVSRPLRGSLLHLLKVCLAQKDHADVVRTAEHLANLADVRWIDQLEAARACSLCIGVARSDSRLSDTEKNRLAEDYGSRSQSSIKIFSTRPNTAESTYAMSGQTPSAELLQNVRDGSESAAAELFDRFVARLTRLARMRLALKLQQRIDPEDVVLSAYRSFFVGVHNNRFTIEQSGDLWRLLARMTLHKLARRAKHHTAAKRSIDNESHANEPATVVDREPTPDEAVAFAEEIEQLMRSLKPTARRVLELKLQGYRVADIAREIGRNDRTIRRNLTTIRNAILASGGFQPADGFDQLEQSPDGDSADRSRDSGEFSIDEETHRIAEALFARMGERQFAEFRLQQHIGTGASGRVYRSLELSSARTVAVKFLKKELLSNSGLVKRFLAEADVVSRFDHPAIVAQQGIGRTPIGGFFIVQDWVDGPNLAEAASQTPPDIATASLWIAEAAEGIQHANDRGVIHCDLKPSNILLGRDGSIRVTDFGLSQRVETAGAAPTSIAGTVGFMAPEQIEPACGTISPRTDVYGLGAVLFALLTGRPPVVTERIEETLTRVVAGNAIPAVQSLRSDTPDALSAIISRCLNLIPEQRFAKATDLAAALRAFR
eukprot:g26678.t1